MQTVTGLLHTHLSTNIHTLLLLVLIACEGQEYVNSASHTREYHKDLDVAS